MGFVDASSAMTAEKMRLVRRAFSGMLLLVWLFRLTAQGADFHTNAIFNVSFSLRGGAQNTMLLPLFPLYSLTNIWSIAPSNDPGAIITPSGANQRTIAINGFSNHLYVVSRTSPTASNYVIYALDAATGTNVFTLSTTGIFHNGAVGEGGIGLASIAVADDGAIYACNMSVDACGCGVDAGAPNVPEDSLFRVYRWADGNSNTAPVEIFSGDPAGQSMPVRWGDTLAVQGKGTNTEILLDSVQGNIAALLKPSDEFMTNFTSLYFTNKAVSAGISRSLQFGGTNQFWQRRSGGAFRVSRYDTTNHTFTVIANYGHLPATLGPAAVDFKSLTVAGVDFNGNATTPDRVELYNFQTPTAPGLLDFSNFPTVQQSNPDAAGQVVFGGNRVWTLDANNGLMAFNVSGPHTRGLYTIIPGLFGTKEIIVALTNAVNSTNDLAGAKLLLKTQNLGPSNAVSFFILRKGTNDVDVSAFLPLPGQPAAVTAESINPAATLTNATDYTVTTFTMSSPVIRFDLRGFGIWKSSSVVDRGTTIMAEPFPSAITVSSLDGVAYVQGDSLLVHGSAAITGRKVEIVPNRPPSVALLNPTNNQSFTAVTNITLSASASDSDGKVALVEFFQDGVKLGERATAPYSFVWTNVATGTFGLAVKATDNDGASSQSFTNTIIVNP